MTFLKNLFRSLKPLNTDSMLAIIDVQSDFMDTAAKVVDQCVAEVKKAILQKEWIAIVEYEGSGWTDTRITDLLIDYPRRFDVFKKQNSGASEFYRVLVKLNVFPRRLKVCGVNTSYCVRSTVEGLLKSLYRTKIAVLSHACNCHRPKEHYQTLEELKRLGIEII